MQFIRKILNSKDLANIIDLPLEMKDTTVEVLVLPVSETKFATHETFDKFENILGISPEESAREINSIRSELERF